MLWPDWHSKYDRQLCGSTIWAWFRWPLHAFCRTRFIPLRDPHATKRLGRHWCDSRSKSWPSGQIKSNLFRFWHSWYPWQSWGSENRVPLGRLEHSWWEKIVWTTMSLSQWDNETHIHWQPHIDIGWHIVTLCRSTSTSRSTRMNTTFK